MRRSLPWRDPWQVCRALAGGGSTPLVFLDGDGSRPGSPSLLGLEPIAQKTCRGLPGMPGATDPFDALEAMRRDGGTWMGWLSYEAGAWVEPADHWRAPDMAVLWAGRFDPLLRFERDRGELVLEGEDPGRLEALAERLDHLPEPDADPGPGFSGIGRDRWQWHTPPERYAEQVAVLREWIAAGDLFQANLTSCCEVRLAVPPDPLALHGRLRHRCPAPFAGLAIAAAEAVISASPECFLQVGSDGSVETRPIKGTRPRHADPAADAASAAELVCAPKDRAENVMIVDLLRNDLGRVCRPGSIRVPQLVGLESYAQVHHLTSVVTGRLAPGRTPVDLLRACWPGGSITGAPKVRACRRLAQLEPLPRGPYCGSLFRMGGDGSFEATILIRSVMQKGGRLRVHAGGGIVADSDPEAEAVEMGWKIDPLLDALA